MHSTAPIERRQRAGSGAPPRRGAGLLARRLGRRQGAAVTTCSGVLRPTRRPRAKSCQGDPCSQSLGP
eukprot:6859164-Alexandrium_andersonii.AAC.1